MLSAFIGRSFRNEDDDLWAEIRKQLDSLKKIGFTWEDAEESQAKSISEKVKERIERNDLFIGLLTKREPVCKKVCSITKQYCISKIVDWATSYWVIQESGYAIGKGRKVFFLIEKGLSLPQGLNADLEYIEIDRVNPSLSFAKMNQIIANEIALKLVPMIEVESIKGMEKVISGKAEIEEEEKEELGQEAKEKQKGFDDYFKMIEFIKEKDYEKAESSFTSLMETETGHMKQMICARYYRNLYLSGKTEALEQLRTFVDENASFYLGIHMLIDCYTFYDDYAQAAATAVKYIDASDNKELKMSLSVLKSELNIKQKNYEDALNTIYPFMEGTAEHSSEKNFELYKALGDIYKEMNMLDISCALYDMALNYRPTNTSVRFAVAYDYDQIKRHWLSLYHYKAHLKTDVGMHVLNNLGVEYAQLKLLGKRVDTYKKALAKGETLASANLSKIYIDNGLYEEAETILKEASKKEDHHQNVDYFANLLITSLENEEKEEEKILEKVKEYRKYIFDYAKAVSLKFDRYDELNGQWFVNNKDIGVINIKFAPPNQVIGQYKFEYTVPSSALQIAILGSGEERRTKEINFKGTIINRGIKYSMSVKEYPEKPSLLSSDTKEFSGFGILRDVDREMIFVIDKERDFDVFKANKTNDDL
jgi:tetratricopeptide (TPR) repeat protein